jgi:hypothetical protein
MFAKAMKSVSIVAMLLSFLWCFLGRDQAWSVQVGGYLEVLVLMVWMTAVMVAVQAAFTHEYLWAVGFVAIAVLFNPIAPLTLSRSTFLILDSICILFFVLSVAVLRTGGKRNLSIEAN